MVVGGRILMPLSGRVFVLVAVLELTVAMGMHVAQSGHGLRVSRGRRIAAGPLGLLRRRVLISPPCAARR